MNFRLFSTDLDGTIVGDPEGTARFRRFWESLPDEQRPLLAFNTGRPLDDTRNLIGVAGLPVPDYIIAGVGTEIFDYGRQLLLPEYHESFGVHWDLRKIEDIVGATPGIERQPPENLHPYKSSWYWHDASKEDRSELEQRLEDAGIEACVIYSSDRDLDVLPAKANKGNALRWLADRLKLDHATLLVAGDSGNDSSMFYVSDVRGIVVGNARAELIEAIAGLEIYRASAEIADGVLEGFRHYGLKS